MTRIDALALARDLVRIDTVNPPGNEDRCIAVLHDLLAAAGFECATVALAAGRSSLVARLPGRGPGLPLCFTGHVDVVPLGTATWKHDPFGAEVTDGKLYGRGSTDMKAGIAAFLSAALAMTAQIREGPGLSVVITAGEETGCEGAAKVASDARALDLLGTAGALLVGEPTGNQPLLGHKGALWLSATAAGKTAHGSMPHEGDNAVYRLARAALGLERMDFAVDPHPLMGMPSINVGTFHGGININSVPDSAVMGVDVRTIAGQDHESVFRCICHRVGPGVALRRILDIESVFTPADDPWMRRVFEIGERHTGVPIRAGTVPFFTDAAKLRLPLGAPPVVILGPGEPALAHQTDEYCRVDRILEAREIYADLIDDWCDPAVE